MTAATPKLASFLLIASLAALSPCSDARDLGVIGKLYPVAEQDMIEMIKAKLVEKQRTGELDKWTQQARQRARAYARRPPGAALPRAKEYRGHPYDPSVVLGNDILDGEGKVLHAAGTRINTLDSAPLNRTLCFVDADDSKQLEWLKTYCPDPSRSIRILVNGDMEITTQRVGSPLYFDQKQQLVQRFDIQAVPAVVRQSGKVLYVEEFPLP